MLPQAMVTIMFDPTITAGNLIEIGAMLLGGISVFITLRNTVGTLQDKVGEMQEEIKKLATVITTMAIADLRLTRLEEDFRELRKGNGWILKEHQ